MVVVQPESRSSPTPTRVETSIASASRPRQISYRPTNQSKSSALWNGGRLRVRVW